MYAEVPAWLALFPVAVLVPFVAWRLYRWFRQFLQGCHPWVARQYVTLAWGSALPLLFVLTSWLVSAVVGHR